MPRPNPRSGAAARGRRLTVASLLTLALACLASGLAPFAHRAAGSGPSAPTPGDPLAVTPAAAAARARALEGYGRLPLRFEPNVGQAEPGVDFISRGEGYGLFLKGTEAVLALRHAADGAGGGAPDRTSVLRMKLVGARRARGRGRGRGARPPRPT